MPEWSGGPCPRCGDVMPARVVHCRSCQQLLNDELEVGPVVAPSFVPLKELAAVAVAAPRGRYDDCPACGRELRAHRKYEGHLVRCKYCDAGFHLGRGLGSDSGAKAYYTDCPHCRKELRIGAKYVAQRVACNFCGGEIDFRGSDEDMQFG